MGSARPMWTERDRPLGGYGTQKARATVEDTGSSGQNPWASGTPQPHSGREPWGPLSVLRGKADTWLLGLFLGRARSLHVGI